MSFLPNAEKCRKLLVEKSYPQLATLADHGKCTMYNLCYCMPRKWGLLEILRPRTLAFYLQRKLKYLKNINIQTFIHIYVKIQILHRNIHVLHLFITRPHFVQGISLNYNVQSETITKLIKKYLSPWLFYAVNKIKVKLH